MIKCSRKKIKLNGGIFCIRRLEKITEEDCAKCGLSDNGKYKESREHKRRRVGKEYSLGGKIIKV